VPDTSTATTTHRGSRVSPATTTSAAPAVQSAPSAAVLRSAAYASPPAASGRTPLRAGAPTPPVAVAVLADDPLIGQGAAAHLRAHQEVRVLDAGRQAEAEVALIIVDRITEGTLELVERLARETVAEEIRFVLVGDGLRRQQLVRAVGCGLVSVIPRHETDLDRILRAIIEVRQGRPELPGVALGWLVGQLRALHRDVLEPRGLTATGLEAREAAVLGLLSEGLSTDEIAQHLDLPVRTVKHVIHGMLTRLKLRNRTHAVAFAVRSGAL
jgi:DNA-binding NarL/FixJ family response regulator